MRIRHLLMGGVLAILVLATQSGAVLAQQPPLRTIDVQGIAVVPVEPNGATFDVTFVNVNTNLPEAYRTVLTQSQTVSDAIIALGVAPEDVRFGNISIFAEDIIVAAPTNRPSGEFVHRVILSLNITVRQFPLIEAVIQTATDLGANGINNMFMLYDDLSGFEQQARQTALEEARGRAQVIADTYRVILGDLVNVQERITTGFSPILISDATTGRFNVTVVITATFEVETPLR